MANTEKNFDQYFKEKLATHEEKPSALAWERLESQLPKKEKAGFYPFLKLAAAILLLLSAGIVLLKWSGDEQSTQQQVAEIAPEQVESPSEEKEEVESIAPTPTQEEENVETKIPARKKASTSGKKEMSPKPAIVNQEPVMEKMVAEAIEPREETIVVQMDLPEIKLPDLKITEAVAINDVVEEAPEYKVIIKSKGLKEEAPKQGLIGELEEKVEKNRRHLEQIGSRFCRPAGCKGKPFCQQQS